MITLNQVTFSQQEPLQNASSQSCITCAQLRTIFTTKRVLDNRERSLDCNLSLEQVSPDHTLGGYQSGTTIAQTHYTDSRVCGSGGRMSQNNSQFVVGLLHDHSEFMKPLEEASSAAFHLALDGSGPSAAANCKAAWKFVFEQAIPHMEHEEEVLFPEALDRGMAKEIVSLLETDHRALREIAQDIQKAGLTEESRTVAPEVANLIARFVKIFEWHVEREESLIKLGIAEKPNDESPLPKRKALTAITLFARCEQNERFFFIFSAIARTDSANKRSNAVDTNQPRLSSLKTSLKTKSEAQTAK